MEGLEQSSTYQGLSDSVLDLPDWADGLLDCNQSGWSRSSLVSLIDQELSLVSLQGLETSVTFAKLEILCLY